MIPSARTLFLFLIASTLAIGCSGLSSSPQAPLVTPTASFAPAVSASVVGLPTPTPTPTASADVIFR